MSEFKLIVAGGRDFNDYALLHESIMKVVHELPDDLVVSIVSGMARGADMLAAHFADETGTTLHEFPADWEGQGKAAGFVRNTDMANFADGLLAFWDGKSKGTAHMIRTMENRRKPVHVVRY